MDKKRIYTVLMIIATLSACGGNSENDFQAAANAFKNEDYSKAVVLLKNVVSNNPQDVESRYLLGKANLALGDFASAEKELDYAYRLGKQNIDAVALLVTALYRNESYNELQKILSATEKTSSATDYYLALSLRKLGKLDESRNAIESAIQSGGEYSTLARALKAFNDDDIEAAIRLADNAEDVLGVNSEATWLKTQILSVSDKPSQAVELLEDYVQEKPYDYRAKLLLAVELLRSKQYKAAEPIVDEFIRKNKNSGFLSELKGYIELAERGEKAALPLLMNAYQMGRRSSSLALTTANAAYKLEQYETAHRFLSLVNIDETGQEQFVKQLRLQVALKLGYTDEALSIYTNSEAAGNNLNSSLVAELGYQLHRSGEVSEANRLTKNFTLNKAKDDKFLGSVIDFLNGKDVSFAELNQRASGEEDETVLLILAALQNRNFETALDIAENWVESSDSGGKVSALEFAAFAALESGKAETAKSYYERLLAYAPNHIAANLSRIQPQIEAELWEDVEPVIARLAKNHPANDRILRFYFDVQSNNGDTSASEILIQNYHNKLSDLRSALLHAYVLFVKKDFDLVVELLKGYISQTEPSINLLRYYVFSLSSTGRTKEAASTLSSLSQKYPNNSSISLFLIHMLEALSKFSDAEHEAAKLANAYPDDKRLIIVRANLLIRQQKFEKAQLLLSQFPKELRNLNVYKATMGKVLLATGNSKEAVALLSDVVESENSSDNVMYYVYALAAEKRHSEAFDVLRGHIKTNPTDIAAITALADGVKSVDPREAIELYDRILKLDEDNIIALNNSAYLHMQIGDIAASKQKVNKALAIKNSEPFLIDTAARIHAADNNVSLGNSLYSSIVKPSSGIAIVSMYCEYLIDTNQPDEGMLCLLNAKTKFGDNFSRMKELERKLKGIM